MKPVAPLILFWFLFYSPMLSSAGALYPNEITYVYAANFFLCGGDRLSVYFKDGDALIDYTNGYGENCQNFALFNESFSLVIEDAYSNISELFAGSVNISSIPKWNTTRHQMTATPCDGFKYSQDLDLLYGNETISVEHLGLPYSCSGTETTKSHPDILVEINFVHLLVINLANRTRSSSPSSPTVDLPDSLGSPNTVGNKLPVFPLLLFLSSTVAIVRLRGRRTE